MDPQSLVDQLVSLPDAAARRALLTQHASDLDDAFLRSDLQRSLQTAELLCPLPEFTGRSCHRTRRLRYPLLEIAASNLPVRWTTYRRWGR